MKNPRRRGDIRHQSDVTLDPELLRRIRPPLDENTIRRVTKGLAYLGVRTAGQAEFKGVGGLANPWAGMLDSDVKLVLDVTKEMKKKTEEHN